MLGKTIRGATIVAAVIASSAACSDRAAHTKLDKLDQRIAGLEKSLDRLDTIAVRLGSLTRQVDRFDELSTKIDRIEQATARVGAGRLGGLGGLGALGGRGAVGGLRRPTRPDPKQVYAVPIAGSPFRGSRHARVTIVKAFEFACPFCRRVAPTMDALLKDYPRDVKVVYKHFIVHPNTARIPAQAACAAHQQGKFTQMMNLIWDKGFDAARNLSRENMMTLARTARLDMSRFRADMDGVCVQVLKRDNDQLRRVGARGTPGFFINGRFLSGAQSIANFRRLIDEELGKAKTRIAEGTPIKKYYRTWVLDHGKKSVAR